MQDKLKIAYKTLELPVPYYELYITICCNLYKKPTKFNPYYSEFKKDKRNKEQPANLIHRLTVYHSKYVNPSHRFQRHTYNIALVIRNRLHCQRRTRCGYIELLLVLACWPSKLKDGWRSSACAKEPLDGTSSSRSWSEFSSTKLKESNMRELPSVGKANRLLGLKQELSLSMSSLFS